jgi:hypothetical protein
MSILTEAEAVGRLKDYKTNFTTWQQKLKESKHEPQAKFLGEKILPWISFLLVDFRGRSASRKMVTEAGMGTQATIAANTVEMRRELGEYLINTASSAGDLIRQAFPHLNFEGLQNWEPYWNELTSFPVFLAHLLDFFPLSDPNNQQLETAVKGA